MSTPAHPLPRRYSLTVDEYHRMGEAGIFPPGARTELIDGEIIETAPVGAPHAGLTKRLINRLTQLVGSRAIVDAQDPIAVGAHSEPQPDLALLRWREDFYVKSHPQPDDVLLVIEIADTTLEYDRNTKIPLYARAGIREVWLIDVNAKRLDIHRQPEEGRYSSLQRARALDRLRVEALPDLVMDLGGLFDGI